MFYIYNIIVIIILCILYLQCYSHNNFVYYVFTYLFLCILKVHIYFCIYRIYIIALIVSSSYFIMYILYLRIYLCISALFYIHIITSPLYFRIFILYTIKMVLFMFLGQPMLCGINDLSFCKSFIYISCKFYCVFFIYKT